MQELRAVQMHKASIQTATRTLNGIVAGARAVDVRTIANIPELHKIGARKRILFQEILSATSGGVCGKGRALCDTLMTELVVSDRYGNNQRVAVNLRCSEVVGNR